MILVVHPKYGSRILIFYPSRIPDPVVKKARDPGSGAGALVKTSNRHLRSDHIRHRATGIRRTFR